jgi:protocatechuate 3,4-dioxygenase beta subunit
MTRHHDHPTEVHDLGLGYDLTTLVNRRRALGLAAGAGAVLLAACGSKSSATSPSTSAAAAASTTASTTASTSTVASGADTSREIVQETAGPYPADGTNGPNVLAMTGIVRSDITSSFGTSTTKATGVAWKIRLQIVKVGAGTVLAGAAVYAWHCSASGLYSLYSNGVTNENYLRGLQVADKDGFVTFDSIFPGAYSGRWPHVHFEVYSTLDQATTGKAAITTSQLALSEEVANAVYKTAGYEASPANMTRTTLANDNVFGDGAKTETPEFTGDIGDNLSATLVVPVQ